MRTYLLTTCLLMLLSATARAQTQAQAHKMEDVLKVEETLREALLKTDTLTIDRYLAEGYTYTIPNGDIVTKARFLADIKAWWKPLAVDHTGQQVRFYGDVAIVLGKALYTWKKEQGVTEQAQEQYTDTYIYKGGTWIRLSSHAACLSGRCS